MNAVPRARAAPLLLIASLSVIPALVVGLIKGFVFFDGIVLPGFVLGLGVWAADRSNARGGSGWASVVFVTVIMLVLWLYMRLISGTLI